ncbi:MAG: peroxide stress protein YaaA [Proteobacteria bacterium]|nr:peroxide stress protein YaaA [Pseudomonadota bacterium]
MLITLSPSKGQDFEQASPTETFTIPAQLAASNELVKELIKFTVDELKQLMSISDNLAKLNYQRYQDFSTPFNPQNAKQALFAFKGDVYAGINTSSMQQQDFAYAQSHLRILSGLYGCLKPLDLMQAYRLEMKTKFANNKGDNLYKFWGNSITNELNLTLAKQQQKVLVNLASNEYWRAVNPKQINGKIVHVAFKENKDGKSRIIAIFAKKARGMMADYLIRNQIETIEGLKGFDYDGYKIDNKLSTDTQLIFSRTQPKPKLKIKNK